MKMEENLLILYILISQCQKIDLNGTNQLQLGDILHLDIHFPKNKDLTRKKIIILI